MSAGKLKNIRWELFCKEYLVTDFNATQAAINVKYSKKTAYSMGARLLTYPRVQERISDLINEDLGTTRDQLRYKVIKRISKMAFSELSEDVKVVTKEIPVTIFDEKGNPKTIHKEIKSVDIATTENMKNRDIISSIKQSDKGGIEVKYPDQLKALELLGRYGALFTDKIEIEDKTETIVFYIPENNRDNMETKS